MAAKQLRALARWSVSAALGSAAHGCGDADYAWTPIACDRGRNVLFDPSFERDVDFAGLYVSARYRSPADPNPQPQVSMYGEWGEPCRSALASAECTSRVTSAKQPSEACRQDGHCGPFAVTTLGDDVSIITQRSELLALLGKIDTASDAMAVSAWDGDPIACADTMQKLAGTRARPVGDAWRVETEWENCGVGLERQTLMVSAKGETTDRDMVTLGMSNCVIGRRPVGLRAVQQSLRSGSLGAFFASAAHLEAASVFAFERLAQELSVLHAPACLIAAAARSALDEVRHAKAVAQLALRFGAAPLPAAVDALAQRSRFEIALENAVEGCVRETYGAVIGQHQAACALDPVVRDVMRVIAEDEIRHAELAWQVAAWLAPQLSSSERLQLLAAKREALADLLESAARPELPERAAQWIGLPSSRLASQLVVNLAKLSLAA